MLATSAGLLCGVLLSGHTPHLLLHRHCSHYLPSVRSAPMRCDEMNDLLHRHCSHYLPSGCFAPIRRDKIK